MYDSGCGEDPGDIHEVAPPEIGHSMRVDDMFEISDEEWIGKLPIGCLSG
jgi:hypothetical protein